MTLKIFIWNIILLLTICVFFELLGSYYLNQSELYNLPNEEYSSNPRSYFKSKKFSKEYNKTIYYIDRSSEASRVNIGDINPELKIAAIGDSFTYGQGVYLEDNFAYQYFNKLKKQGLKVNLNILGVQGYDVSQVSEKLESDIKTIKPNRIIYGYVLNDTLFEPNNGVKNPLEDLIEVTKKYSATPVMQSFLFKSNFLKWMYYKYSVSKISKKTIDYYKTINNIDLNRQGVNKTINEIKKMNAVAKLNNSKFCVLIFPLFYKLSRYPFLEFHEYLFTALKQENIAVVDTYNSFKNLDEQRLWVHHTDLHPNEHAHKIFAKSVDECGF